MNTTVGSLLSTTLAPMETTSTDLIVGYIAMVVSCVGFGTMFIPLKNQDCRDGFFVQWIECGVVFITGFVINCIRGFPDFEWVVGIGGLLYATGNVFSVPIVGGLGMGLGLLIWGTMQIMVGWSVARFGLFGWLSPTEVAYQWLNYIGLALTVLSGILFVFVKPKSLDFGVASTTETGKSWADEEVQENANNEKVEEAEPGQRSGTTKDLIRKIPFIIMAMILAVLHGLMMSPIDIMKQKHPSNDKYRVFDYCWSFYSTVFVFSTAYFFAYCIVLPVAGRKPYINQKLIVPSILYGILWTTGMTLWFLSGDKLSQVIAYPVTTRLPAIISALFEVLVFKNIVGKRNIIILSISIGIGVAGVVTIALSNQKF